MATRRPKVPKASALSGPRRGDTDGGDVIRADFGAGRGPSEAPAKRHRQPESDTQSKRDAGTLHRDSARGRTTYAVTGRVLKPGATKQDSTKPDFTKQDSARHAAGPKAGDTGAEEQAPVPARAFSGRMLALAVVMIAITVMLAPTVKIFFEKRAEIAGLEDEIAAKKAEQEDLRRQVSRWQDPNYVKQQARDRINMVMPGETSYWVFGGVDPAGTAGSSTGTGASGDPADLPWVDGLWESIRRSATD
jgi:cell division protein FtsB